MAKGQCRADISERTTDLLRCKTYPLPHKDTKIPTINYYNVALIRIRMFHPSRDTIRKETITWSDSLFISWDDVYLVSLGGFEPPTPTLSR